MHDSTPPHTPAGLHRGLSISHLFTDGLYRSGLKRLFDQMFSVLLLPFVIPLLVLLIPLLRLDSGPAFYGHSRIGRDGRRFTCWKLRTMVIDSDAALRRHLDANPEARAEWQARQKLSHDPRVTRLGRFLRASSIDELPQIWNVLRGEMSLVGPRPVTEGELVRYGARRHAYQSVLPGITGLWQVSGRNGISYQRRVALDARYAATLTLGLDLRIMLRTLLVLAGRTGL